MTQARVKSSFQVLGKTQPHMGTPLHRRALVVAKGALVEIEVLDHATPGNGGSFDLGRGCRLAAGRQKQFPASGGLRIRGCSGRMLRRVKEAN
jgi:hypothetical protein